MSLYNLDIVSGIPYDEDDKDFKPLNESELEEWEEWLEYTCKNIGVTMEELKSQNFKYLIDLEKWCASGERYKYAQNKYNSKIKEYWDKWLDELVTYDLLSEFSRNEIEDKMGKWLQGFFENGFIWSCDTEYILETEDGEDVCIFDTSPMEVLYEMLKNQD